MFDTLGLICLIWWCMMLFHSLHAVIQCIESEAQESHITNVKMNWEKMELSWESSRNFSKYECTIMDKDMESILKEVNSPLCTFPLEQYLPLHKGVDFLIEVPNTNISKTCTFIPGGNVYGLGMNGSAIENFSCVVYNVSLMNCTWQAGRNAPADTQYFLYWQNSRHDDDAAECELYIKDENGRNTGCRFQNVKIDTEKAYFLVNGSSKDSLIRFYDEYIQLYEIEILTPPLNVTVNCTRDSAGCIVTWQPPLTSHVENVKCFQYEISIQNKCLAAREEPKMAMSHVNKYVPKASRDFSYTTGRAVGQPTIATTEKVQDNSMDFTVAGDEPKEEKKYPPVRNNIYEFQNYNEKKKYILKIRARGKYCLISSNWGEWSEPIEFGQGKDYFFVILFLIALGTISATLLQYCLFKRYCSFKSILPPIPQPRGKFNVSTDEDIQTEYINIPINSCTEEITMVEETI